LKNTDHDKTKSPIVLQTYTNTSFVMQQTKS